MNITVLNKRKDGKYKVAFDFPGQPNGFGGLTYGRTINKILTADKLREYAMKHPDQRHKFPKHIIDSIN